MEAGARAYAAVKAIEALEAQSPFPIADLKFFPAKSGRTCSRSVVNLKQTSKTLIRACL